MNLLNTLRHALLGRPQPKITRLDAPDSQGMRIDELPPFSLKTADLMRYDPQVRIGLGARNGLLMAAEVEVRGDHPAIVRWVQQQWNALWHSSAHQFLRAKLYGFLPFEVVFRRGAGSEFGGLIEVDRLIDRHPSDTRLLVQGDQIVGFSYENESVGNALRGVPMIDRNARNAEQIANSHSQAPRSEFRTPRSDLVNLFAPQALVCTFDAESTNPYGCALLARAYPAWFEKWMPGGAKKTLRLRMIKDAYIGDIFWYPPDRRFQMPDGSEKSYRDLAQDIVGSRHSGGALTLPLIRDSMGNKLIDYTPPQGIPGYTQIFRWKADLDLEIWKALEVPPEIIQAQTSGSGFSGRWIPFAIALSAVHQELAELLRCIDRDILRPLVQLNFGRPARYEIRPKSLVETYSAMFANREQFRTPSRQPTESSSEAKFE
jgi:hypothetical protein